MKKRPLALPLLTLSLLLPAATLADDHGESAATISAPEIAFTEWSLDNGLRVIALPDNSTANVTTSLWYEVGAKHDPEGRAGFAHLFEHILSRKTVNMPFNVINDLTQDVGGTRNASTSADRTNYYETVPAAYLETMLWTHAERMARPVVDQAIFEGERDIVKEELRQRVLAPPYGRLVSFVIPENAYDALPLRRPTIGSIPDLDAATLDDARGFHQAYYGPDTATLIVAGNFDTERLRGLVDEYFAEIPPRANPLPLEITVEEPVRTEPRTVNATAPSVPLPATGTIWKIPGENHPDRAALDVLNAILGRGENARLHEALVRSGKAVQAAQFINGSEDAGFFANFAITSPGADLPEVEAILTAEMDRVRSEPVTEAELREAKNELFSAALARRQTASGRAFELGEALVRTGDPRAADRRLQAVATVTSDDVLRVAQTWLKPEARVDLTYTQGEDDPSVYANPTPMPTFASIPPATGEPLQVLPEGERQEPPPPGPAPEVDKPGFVERSLSNGIPLVTSRTGDVPIATVTVVLPGGDASDPEGKSGTAGMTAGIANMGTATRSAQEIAATLESLGASFGAGTGNDGTTISMTAPVATLGEAGAVLSDIVRNASYPAEELERERARAIDGLRVSLEDPGSLAGLVATRVMYGDAPYGAVTTLNSLPRITRDDLLAHRQTYWHPGAARIVISGGIDADQAQSLAEAMFGDWSSDAPVPDAPAEPAGPATAPRTVVVDLPSAGQAAVFAAVRAIPRKDDDYYPLYLANIVLGGGSKGRLFEEVRTKRALSYGSYSSLGSAADNALLTASAQTKNESAAEVAGVILGEFDKLGGEPADEDTLQKRRVFVTGALGRQMETSFGFNSTVSSLLQQGIAPDEVNRFADRLAGVSPEDAARAAEKYVTPDAASLIIVGNASAFLDDLKAVRPNVEVISAADLDLDGSSIAGAVSGP